MNPISGNKLFSWLIDREKFFNEELHNIISGQKKVEFFGEFDGDDPVGWLFSYAEKGSGDWNLARRVGGVDEAAKFLNFLPRCEKHLLTPVPLRERVSDGQTNVGLIFWFEAPDVKKHLAYNSILQSKVRFVTKTRRPQKKYGEFEFDYFSAYLVESEKVIGVAKTIHETQNTCEIYLEVSPRFRGRGLGLRLLEEVNNDCIKRHKKLIYVVEASNKSSLRIAEKFGMRKYQTLKRLVC